VQERIDELGGKLSCLFNMIYYIFSE